MAGYRRMSVAVATDFRKHHQGYNTYSCDIRSSNFFRNDSEEADKGPCKECTYLVNAHKYNIGLSELCTGKYDVIFVSPAWDDEK